LRAFVKTYGCTLNQADSDIISSVLQKDGIELVEQEGAADVVIVNTCTVKNATSQKILYKLNNLDKSGKKTVVTGCMAGANQDMIEKYAPNASIITAPNISEISGMVFDAYNGKKRIINEYKKVDRIGLLNPRGNIISKIAVSDGCLSSCSFCETKFARGTLNSFSENVILKAVKNSVEDGAKEVQLTSQDMGAYGFDKKTNVAELMQKISAIEGDFKVRIGMLNPDHLNRYMDSLLDALQSEKFYKFVHLPVQSGSNRILKSMKRGCRVESFEDYMKEFRSKIPDITIETDIIVGFPGESVDDFEDTVGFIRRAKPDVTNVSRFGARPHAAASKMKQHSHKTINYRSMMLSRAVRSVQHGLNDRFIGKNLDVIITESNERSWNARAGNYKQVIIMRNGEIGRGLEIGSQASVSIKSASANVLYA
jgi:threonylcarbamoyladenosine tRNA methylthiotransferase CDKAL1